MIHRKMILKCTHQVAGSQNWSFGKIPTKEKHYYQLYILMNKMCMIFKVKRVWFLKREEINMIDCRRSYVVNNNDNKSKLFEALPVAGDGNCFYHSVSYFLGVPHHEIKKQCLDFIC